MDLGGLVWEVKARYLAKSGVWVCVEKTGRRILSEIVVVRAYLLLPMINFLSIGRSDGMKLR